MATVIKQSLRSRFKFSTSGMLKSWHRSMGVMAAFFLLLLTVTGVLLLQTDQLRLASRYVDNPSLLNWYGLQPASPPASYPVGARWVAQLGRQLFLNEVAISHTDEVLVGAALVNEEILIATARTLLLVTTGGEVAEKIIPRLDADAFFKQLGTRADGALVLETARERYVFEATSGEIRPDNAAGTVRWHTAAPPPPALRGALEERYRGQGLSLERVLLDLHTGRIFGKVGVALINITSLLLIVLIISGTLLWWRRRQLNGSNDSVP